MPNDNVAQFHKVSSDERSLTFTALDPTINMAFDEETVLFNSQFIDFVMGGAGKTSEDFSYWGDSPDDPEYHTPGTYIEGDDITQGKTNIALDRVLIKQLNIDEGELDESMWNLVEPAAKEVGYRMARMLDQRAFRLLALAARTSSLANVHPGGNVVIRNGAATLAAHYPVSSTGANNMRDDLSNLARLYDEDNIPENGRFAFISPYLRQVATYHSQYLDRDYVPETVGRLQDRFVGRMEGFNLIVANNRLPSTNVSTGLSKYQLDALLASGGECAMLTASTAGVKAVLGGIQIGGITGRVFYDENRETWKVRSRYHGGQGVLTPWLAGEVRLTNT